MRRIGPSWTRSRPIAWLSTHAVDEASGPLSSASSRRVASRPRFEQLGWEAEEETSREDRELRATLSPCWAARPGVLALQEEARRRWMPIWPAGRGSIRTSLARPCGRGDHGDTALRRTWNA